MTQLLDQAALICTIAGLLAGAATAAAARNGRLGLRVALDFWLAAGLLRLAGPVSVTTVATAAGLLVIRELVMFGLRESAPTPHRRTSTASPR